MVKGMERNDLNYFFVQEVPTDKGKQVLKIIHSYKHATSIFDDFIHYEKRQEEDEVRKPTGPKVRLQA